MVKFKKKTEGGVSYNLEATPAEGTSYRLARLDYKLYGKDIITAGDKVPYYRTLHNYQSITLMTL